MDKDNKVNIVSNTHRIFLANERDKDETVKKILIEKGFKQINKTEFKRGLDSIVMCFYPCRMGINIRLANDKIIDIDCNTPLDKVLSVLNRKL